MRWGWLTTLKGLPSSQRSRPSVPWSVWFSNEGVLYGLGPWRQREGPGLEAEWSPFLNTALGRG